MDWSTINFDWNRARAFLVTAEEGSFSAAARALGLTQPTLSRQVAALEEELNIALIERVGRGIQLTPTGLDMLEHMRAMSEAATRASVVAAGQSLSLRGSIRISASEVISAHLLPPIILKIRREYPNIEIEIIATNSTSDLRKREADIAIRNFEPQDTELIGRKLGESPAYLYATPAYLQEIGNPTTLEALSEGKFIGFDRSDMFMDGLNQMGLRLEPANFPILTMNQMVQWELVKLGAGIGIMLEEIGKPEPKVVRALTSFAGYKTPFWLMCHRELRTSRRVRVVYDLLAEGLSQPKA